MNYKEIDEKLEWIEKEKKFCNKILEEELNRRKKIYKLCIWNRIEKPKGWIFKRCPECNSKLNKEIKLSERKNRYWNLTYTLISCSKCHYEYITKRSEHLLMF